MTPDHAEKHILPGNADCVEFCPATGYEDVLAAATYTLVEGLPAQRIGTIQLFQVAPSECTMREVYRHETAGVFDIKWENFESGAEPPRLGQASADGKVVIYSLKGDSSKESVESEGEEADENDWRYSLKFLEEVACSDAMCLALEWRPFSEGCQIAASCSDGSLATISFEEAEISVESTWSAHSYEAWTTTYDRWHREVVYSGGDDCAFSAWDLRTNLSCPIFRELRAHTMGVCCMQSSHLSEFKLCTGSYDESVRVWDTRQLSQPVLTQQVATGGGVWRLKWHPHQQDLLLAACMHNGVAVIDVSGGAGKEMRPRGLFGDDSSTASPVPQAGDGNEVEHDGHASRGETDVRTPQNVSLQRSMLKQYLQHTSLAYGVDWYRSELQPQEIPGRSVGQSANDDALELSSSNQPLPDTMALKGPSDQIEPVRYHGGEKSGREGKTHWQHGSFKNNLARREVRFRGNGSALADAPTCTSTWRGEQEENSLTCLIASCSFYDKTLHLWSWRRTA